MRRGRPTNSISEGLLGGMDEVKAKRKQRAEKEAEEAAKKAEKESKPKQFS